MTTRQITLNVWRNAHAVVTAVQGEHAARWLQITLYDKEEPLNLTGKTTAIYMTKPDRTIVYNVCTITNAEQGIIEVALTSQMTAVWGTISDCEIHVLDQNGSLLKITGLTIVVDQSLENDRAIESSNEFTLLLQALHKTEGIADTISNVLQEKIEQFDSDFRTFTEQKNSEVEQWLTQSDATIVYKLQSVDDWLSDSQQELQHTIEQTKQQTETAVTAADSAAQRANAAVDSMAQTAATLVEDAVDKQKNQPNGIAGLNSSGKLVQMPTASDIGAVPTTRKINNKSLSGDLTLSAADVSAIPTSEKNAANGIAGLNSSGKLMQMPTASDVGAVPTTRKINNKALSGDLTLSAADVSAIPTSEKNTANGIAGLNSSGKLVQMPTASDIGAVPTTRKINNKSLSGDLTLSAADVSAIPTSEKNAANGIAGLNSSGKLMQMPTASDIGAVPTGRTVNGKALSGNITLTPADIGVGALFLAMHPVGSLYFSAVSTSPQTLFGGTWVQWGSGRVPVGVNTADSDFNSVEKTGGAKTHTLTVNEMPGHTHTAYTQGGWGAGSLGSGMFRVDANSPANTWADSATSATGGGRAHNNMPPYITCYMWKRTA